MTPVSYPKRMPPKAAKRVYKGQTTVRTPAMRADEIEMRRTERIPAQTFLGALAPIPLPVASAPPAMIGRRVRMCGERRVVLREGGSGGGQGVLRSQNAPCFISNPGTRREVRSRISRTPPHDHPLPATELLHLEIFLSGPVSPSGFQSFYHLVSRLSLQTREEQGLCRPLRVFSRFGSTGTGF